jgi:SAM-dependent methyltransferase
VASPCVCDPLACADSGRGAISRRAARKVGLVIEERNDIGEAYCSPGRAIAEHLRDNTIVSASARQLGSKGISSAAILEAALSHADPLEGLTWLDIGCGTGDALAAVRDRFAPAHLHGLDVVRFLEPSMAASVTYVVAPAETALASQHTVDRVLMIESLEHMEAPWSVLRLACRVVASSGVIIVTTPNTASLRSRLDLGFRGELSDFRPDHASHLTPCLPHVVRGVMEDEGLAVTQRYVGPDMLPRSSRGRLWPERVYRTGSSLFFRSVLTRGVRVGGPSTA